MTPFWVAIMAGTFTVCLGALLNVWAIRKMRKEAEEDKLPADLSTMKITIEELLRRMEESEIEIDRNRNRLIGTREIVERIRGRLKMNGNYEEG